MLSPHVFCFETSGIAVHWNGFMYSRPIHVLPCIEHQRSAQPSPLLDLDDWTLVLYFKTEKWRGQAPHSDGLLFTTLTFFFPKFGHYFKPKCRICIQTQNPNFNFVFFSELQQTNQLIIQNQINQCNKCEVKSSISHLFLFIFLRFG